jgi:hypothetical protein
MPDATRAPATAQTNFAREQDAHASADWSRPRSAGSTSGTARLGFAPADTTRMTNPATSSS